MPPRFAYWTIILDGQPTAFRTQHRDELLPTLRQLQSRHPSAVMMWFARGKLWASPEEARKAERQKQERRPPDWRPGGDHRDPRERFHVPRDEKRRRFAARLRRPPAGAESNREGPGARQRRSTAEWKKPAPRKREEERPPLPGTRPRERQTTPGRKSGGTSPDRERKPGPGRSPASQGERGAPRAGERPRSAGGRRPARPGRKPPGRGGSR